jgi:nicotinamidase-related amidase
MSREDLHGNVPDTAHTALLIIDMINEFSFPDAATMFPAIISLAERIAALKRRVKAAGFPLIYVNDNFGKWQSDFRKLVIRCLEEPCRGQEVTKLLRPEEDDYFVLKPRHSGFYATPLELLLTCLKAKRLILTDAPGLWNIWPPC